MQSKNKLNIKTKDLIQALEEADRGAFIKLAMWLHKNHLKVLREYEDKECNGIHLAVLE